MRGRSQKGLQEILNVLRQSPDMSTTELAVQNGMSCCAMAKHIAALQAFGTLLRMTLIRVVIGKCFVSDRGNESYEGIPCRCNGHTVEREINK